MKKARLLPLLLLAAVVTVMTSVEAGSSPSAWEGVSTNLPCDLKHTMDAEK